MKNSNFILLVSLNLLLVHVYAQNYGESAHFSLLGGTDNIAINTDAALDQPEYPNWSNSSFVALGGGMIIIDLGGYAINELGPDLKIYEVGESYGTGSEPYYILGSESSDHNGWQYLGSYPGDVQEIEFDDFNVNKVRYVAIFDSNPNTNNPYVHPGCDIDGVEALNFESLSVSEKYLTDFEINIYPNPALNSINVYIETNDLNYFNAELHTLTGKLVLIKSFNNNDFEIDISHIKNGAYILKIEDESGNVIKSEKIIKE